MLPQDQYQSAAAKAREVRASHGIDSTRVMVNELKKICRSEGIEQIEFWKHFTGVKIKGGYFRDAYGNTLMINMNISKARDAKAFTIAHELKHHLMDEMREIALCLADEEHKVAERAADVFAAELLFPSEHFVQHMNDRSVALGQCTPEDIVHIKHTTDTTLSHTGLAIRAAQLGYATPNSLSGVPWFKLRNRLYPEYLLYRT